jgi:hypothetical protein
VAGSRDIDHVKIMRFDDAVQMHVDQVEPRGGTPVAEQARLGVLELERILEERIVKQVDLSDREIIRGAPVGSARAGSQSFPRSSPTLGQSLCNHR